jgi:hypothetical protein
VVDPRRRELDAAALELGISGTEAIGTRELALTLCGMFIDVDRARVGLRDSTPLVDAPTAHLARRAIILVETREVSP